MTKPPLILLTHNQTTSDPGDHMTKPLVTLVSTWPNHRWSSLMPICPRPWWRTNVYL